jgi:hypothetical protein
VTAIEKDVFVYCENITEIHIPEGVTFVGSEAFCNCWKLKDVYFPSSIQQIGDRLFGQSNFIQPGNIRIHAPAGSYAEQYANENGFAFVAE